MEWPPISILHEKEGWDWNWVHIDLLAALIPCQAQIVSINFIPFENTQFLYLAITIQMEPLPDGFKWKEEIFPTSYCSEQKVEVQNE